VSTNLTKSSKIITYYLYVADLTGTPTVVVSN